MQAPLERRSFIDEGTTTTVLLGAVAFVAVWAIVGMWPATAPKVLDLWRGNALLEAHRIARSLGVETFAASGYFGGYQGWLGFGILAALNSFGGGVAPALAGGAAFAIALVLTVSRVRGLIASVGVAIVLAVATLGSAHGLIACLSLVALAAAIGLLDRLERNPRRYGLACFVLAVFWANLDAAALFVPVLAGLYALGASIDAREFSPRARRYGLLAIATLVATCVTPFGFDLPLRAGQHLGIGPGISQLLAWQPSAVAPHAYWTVLVPLLLAGAVVGLGRRGDATSTLCVFGAILLALSNGAYVAEAVLVVGPVLALRLLPVEGRISPADRFALASAALAAASVIVAVLATFPGLLQPASAEPSLRNVPLTSLLDGRAHRIVCTPLVLCDEIVARDNPNLRVLMDGRVNAYPSAVRRDEVTIGTLRDGWVNVLRARHIDRIAVRSGGTVAGVLALDRRWSLLAENESAALFGLTQTTR